MGVFQRLNGKIFLSDGDLQHVINANGRPSDPLMGQ